MPDSCCAYGCTNRREENGNGPFTDSHVERKERNKNYEKSGFKHVREKIGQNIRSVIQEFVKIISLQVSTMTWYIALKFLIGVLYIYLSKSR